MTIPSSLPLTTMLPTRFAPWMLASKNRTPLTRLRNFRLTADPPLRIDFLGWHDNGTFPYFGEQTGREPSSFPRPVRIQKSKFLSININSTQWPYVGNPLGEAPRGRFAENGRREHPGHRRRGRPESIGCPPWPPTHRSPNGGTPSIF